MADIGKLDLNSLTLDETIDFEEISGIDIAEILERVDSKTGEFNMKGLKVTRLYKALTYIAAKRDDPAVTLESVGGTLLMDAMKLTDLTVTPITPTEGDA